MGSLSAGQVVLIKFPFSDSSAQKLRPCLIIGTAEFGDIIVCQITSKRYSSKRAVPIIKNDFQGGLITTDSFVRPDKIATLDAQIIARVLGKLSEDKMADVNSALKCTLEF